MALLRQKKSDTQLYQTNACYMCCMTYFDTITHPYQNLRTPSDFYAPCSKN